MLHRRRNLTPGESNNFFFLFAIECHVAQLEKGKWASHHSFFTLTEISDIEEGLTSVASVAYIH